MNFLDKLRSLLAIFAAVILIGCGGEDEVAGPVDSNVGPGEEETPKAKKTSAKRSASGGGSGAADSGSALDKIDAALDRGDYMGAVNLAIKSGGNPDENLNNLRYVQQQLGDPMARGDKKAMEAYGKLNAFYIMKHQR